MARAELLEATEVVEERVEDGWSGVLVAVDVGDDVEEDAKGDAKGDAEGDTDDDIIVIGLACADCSALQLYKH